MIYLVFVRLSHLACWIRIISSLIINDLEVDHLNCFIRSSSHHLLHVIHLYLYLDGSICLLIDISWSDLFRDQDERISYLMPWQIHHFDQSFSLNLFINLCFRLIIMVFSHLRNYELIVFRDHKELLDHHLYHLRCVVLQSFLLNLFRGCYLILVITDAHPHQNLLLTSSTNHKELQVIHLNQYHHVIYQNF